MSELRAYLPDSTNWLLDLHKLLVELPCNQSIERQVRERHPQLCCTTGDLMQMLEYARAWIAEDYAEYVAERPTYAFSIGVEVPSLPPGSAVIELLVVYSSKDDNTKGRTFYGVSFVRPSEESYIVFESAGLFAE